MFTMAGLSSRFKRDGYSKQKFMLRAGDLSLFGRILQPYLASQSLIEDFIFAINKADKCYDWLQEEIGSFGINNYQIVELNAATSGQAETAALALNNSTGLKGTPILITNIDTVLHDVNILHYSQQLNNCHGLIEVADLDGDNWSFVEPVSAGSSKVKRFVEKQKISSLASTGLYGFSSSNLYIDAFNEVTSNRDKYLVNNELYISSIYQCLLQESANIRYYVTAGKISLAGTPMQYSQYCQQNDWGIEYP